MIIILIQNQWQLLMYVCICNALTDKQINAALEDGAASWSAVYAHYQCEPKCGKCIPQICERLNSDNPGSSVYFGSSALSNV